MDKKSNFYQETFSHVRSSYVFNMEDFEKMKTKKPVAITKVVVIAAVVAVLAAFGVTAAATGFFGASSVTVPGENGGDSVISMQGFADSPEGQALRDYLFEGLTLEEAAERHGLTVPERCEVYEYDGMKELLGGELTDGRSTRWAFVLYEDGTFSADQEFTASDGTVVSYQLYRAVKGSLTEVSLSAGALGEDYEEWDLKIGGQDVGLVLGSGDRSLIIADLGDSFFAANVLSGMVADPTFGGPITREHLEELAKSMNWEVLSRVAVPEFPEEPAETVFGAGVELDPEYIWEEQSFDVTLDGWGKTGFITYRPTEGFGDVRFFLSKDRKTSDYEFPPKYQSSDLRDVAAVSFEDLCGDEHVDVLVLLDYVNAAGEPYRDVRIFKALGGGEFEMAWDLCEGIRNDLDNSRLDVRAVRTYAKAQREGTGASEDDVVLETQGIEMYFPDEPEARRLELDAVGKMVKDSDRCGVRELRLYDLTSNGGKRGKPFEVIDLYGTVPDFVSSAGLGEGYTDCWTVEDCVSVRDMNFDGYPDIGVFGWTCNNTIPYYYFFWDPEAGAFKYAITLQGAMVDEENGQIVAEYRSGPDEYIRDFYVPDSNGMLQLMTSRTYEQGAYYQPLPGGSEAQGNYEGVLKYLCAGSYEPYYLTYGLFDLTGDGSPELIAEYGTCEADAEAGVWSMDSGELKKLGSFYMGHAALYVSDGRLIRLTGQMGIELIDAIGWDGEKITETNLSQRELGPDDSYAEPGEHLERAADWDTSLLERAGLIKGAE